MVFNLVLSVIVLLQALGEGGIEVRVIDGGVKGPSSACKVEWVNSL